MKKMTIALLTAAAMGTSGFAVAQTGPDFSGRIDIRFTDLEEQTNDNGVTESGELDATNASSKLAVSGGSDDLIGGLSGFYYARMALAESGDADVDYAYTGFEGDFGRLQAGIDDDLVYKFVGVKTDVHRGVGPTGSAAYSTGYGFGAESSLQYHLTMDNVTIAAYADTGDAGEDGLSTNSNNEVISESSEGGFAFADNDGDALTPQQSTGIDRTQVAIGVDLGAVNIGAVYADRDIENYDEEIFVGASADLGVASIRATVADDTAGNNPFNLTAVVPLTDVLTGTLAYGAADDEDDTADVTGMIMANLGGGLDVNASYRNGDSGDGIVFGTRYNF